MKTKITLIADEGKILTDGVHYGRVVYLAPEKSGEDWQEISEEEYATIMEDGEEESDA